MRARARMSLPSSARGIVLDCTKVGRANPRSAKARRIRESTTWAKEAKVSVLSTKAESGIEVFKSPLHKCLSRSPNGHYCMFRAARLFVHKHGSAACRPLERSLLQISSYSTISNADWEDIDVAIVGGGPVGLALACALCQSSLVVDIAFGFVDNR